MARPDERTVRGQFDGAPVALRDGTVTPLRDPAGWWMDVDAGGAHERWRVDLVLASGRQQQLYLSRRPDGTLVPLPLYFSTVGRRWKPTALYFGGALDRGSPMWFGGFEVMGLRCFNCHLSQARHTVDGRTAVTSWGDLAINCEACHGPGKHHVERRRAGLADDYADLRLLGKEREAQLCGSCHAAKDEADFPGELFPETLAAPGLRPDSTQFSTVYQLAGHLMSGCFQRGAVTCSACHAPHSQKARDLTGASAEGADSDRQCTVCHRDRLEATAAAAHTHHSPSVRCIDCHMRRTQIRGTPERLQETSDHSISIPHPAETAELGIANACQKCHAQPPAWASAALERWGARAAAGVRPWVQAVSEARQKRPGATRGLIALLRAPESAPYLQASYLALLAKLPPDPDAPPAIERFVRDPDPQLRALAWEARIAQEPARAAEWRRAALADPHPFVRLSLFPGAAPSAYSDAEIARFEDDLLSHAREPPVQRLRWLAQLERERGQADEAQRLDALARSLGPAH